MSRFFSSRYANLTPYVPGEQPRDKRYIKLNTNESPFPPSPVAQAMVAEAVKDLALYSDPECKEIRELAAKKLGITADEILFFNGSDEALNFAFMAFCDDATPAAFPDITYGFYEVFSNVNNIPFNKIPLQDDFTIRIEDYVNLNQTIFIANPNAPTGLVLPLEAIETICRENPDNVVVIDEAYIDFGGETAIPLIRKYDNLLIIQTFSKSRSMAGGRLGFAAGCPALIKDLNDLRYSTNPFNVNRMSLAAGIGALEDDAYFQANIEAILSARDYTLQSLRTLGFTAADSATNFVFAKHPALDGRKLYLQLKDKGILVRHFNSPRLCDYIRITIGTQTQMEALVTAIRQIMEETL